MNTLVSMDIPELCDGRKGFNHVRRVKRDEYNKMPLSDLKHAFRRVHAQARATNKPSLIQEAEYVRQNIMLIQLCKGVIG